MTNLTNPNLQYLLIAILLMVIGAPALIASTPYSFKNTLLSFDKSGAKTALMGTTFVLAGMFVPDYAAAYIFVLGGLFVTMVGTWIALPDPITDKLLETDFGAIFFVGAAVLTFLAGAFLANDSITYNLHGLITLILPVGGAMLLIMMMVLAASSPELKANLLPKNTEGFELVWKGALLLLVAPFAGINPALMIATAVLATGLMALGLITWMWDWLTRVILDPVFIPLYCFLTGALLFWSRSNF